MKILSTGLVIAILFPLGILAEPGAGQATAEAALELSGLTASEEEAGVFEEVINKFKAVFERFGVKKSTLIAQMINFCLVAAVLYFFAIKPVAKTLDERQQKIADGLEYAEEMKTQLAETERERVEKMREAAQEAQRILSEAREQSREMIEQKTQEAAAQAEAIFRKASEATELERQRMLSEVRQEVTRLVVATSSKVLASELSDEHKRRFSNAAAKELASSAR